MTVNFLRGIKQSHETTIVNALTKAIARDLVFEAHVTNPIYAGRKNWQELRMQQAQAGLAALYEGHLDDAVFHWSVINSEKNKSHDYRFTAYADNFWFEVDPKNFNGNYAWVHVESEGTECVLGSETYRLMRVADICVTQESTKWLEKYHEISETEPFLTWHSELMEGK
jgi:hypothetical protein